jgi:CelD/BcsL family acetyltransferase involved in cellulose biosynthesis
VSDVQGRDEAASIAGVVHVRLFPQWYGRKGPATNYRDRLAFVIAEADSATKAGEIADLGLRQLRIKPIKIVEKWRFMSGRRVISQTSRRVMNLIKQAPAWMATPRSPLLSYSIVRDDMSFNALQSEWEDLFRRAAVQTPFLRHSWLRLCWDRQRDVQGTELFIVVVRKHDRPVLIAPFVKLGNRLSFLDSATPQYNDVLVEDSVDASVYVGYLWKTLGSIRPIRHLVSKWVRDDSLLVEHLAAARQESEPASYRAPFIDLTKFGGWEVYLRSLSGKLRRDHGRLWRNLQRRGAVEFRLANSNTYSNDMAWLFAQKRQWLDEKGKSSTWLKAPGTEELFTAAAKEGIDSGRTWLEVLSVDGETIAASLSFREGSTLYMSKGAYDPAWRTYSPGRTLDLQTIQRAFEEGIQKCDIMIGRGSLKERLATGMIRVRSRKIRLRRP